MQQFEGEGMCLTYLCIIMAPRVAEKNILEVGSGQLEKVYKFWSPADKF